MPKKRGRPGRYYKPKLTHEQRTDRRKKIADWIQETASSIQIAAIRFRVSYEFVRGACMEHGVTIPRNAGTLGHKNTLSVIADLCNTTDTQMSIAKRSGITRQRVSYIYKLCLKAGIPVQVRTPGGTHDASEERRIAGSDDQNQLDGEDDSCG